MFRRCQIAESLRLTPIEEPLWGRTPESARPFPFALHRVLFTASDSHMEHEDEPVNFESMAAQGIQADEPLAFVFKPFSGSLLEIPDAPAPRSHTSEFFLPLTSQAEQSAVEPAAAPSISFAFQDLPAEDTVVAQTPDQPRFADFSKKKGKHEKKEPRFADPTQDSGNQEKEKPHFYHPTPIRFFDPVAAAETGDATGENALPSGETGSRFSNQLPPELKAAIRSIDEQLRQLHVPKEKPVKAKKSRFKKPKPPGRSEKPVFEDSTPEPEFAEAPALGESLVLELQASEPLRLEPLVEAPVAESVSSDAAQAPEIIPTPAADAAPAKVLEAGGQMASPPDEFVGALSSPEEIAEFLEEPLERFVELHAIKEPVSAIEPPPIPAAPAEAEEAVASFEETESPSEVLEVDAIPEQVASVEQPQITEQITEEPSEIPAPEFPEFPATEKPKNQGPRLSLSERFQRWLEGEAPALDGRRRASRTEMPGLVAFYWSGGAPRPHEIVNISRTGFYLRTREVWFPDTLVRMTLQRGQNSEYEEKQTISILARVVRIDDEGVGHEFVTSRALLSIRTRDVLLPEHGTNEKELERFLRLE